MNEEQRHGAEEFAANAINHEGILGNYIVIAEMIHEDGVTLNFAVSDNLPPWTAAGMLQSVASMIDIASMDYGGEPEEPEEL